MMHFENDFWQKLQPSCQTLLVVVCQFFLKITRRDWDENIKLSFSFFLNITLFSLDRKLVDFSFRAYVISIFLFLASDYCLIPFPYNIHTLLYFYLFLSSFLTVRGSCRMNRSLSFGGMETIKLNIVNISVIFIESSIMFINLMLRMIVITKL